jgi:hypothetical protein
MSAVSGIILGVAFAIYILSHYDRRVKKVHALVAALIAALTALADFTSTQIPVGEICTTTTSTTTTTTTGPLGSTITITQTYPVERCTIRYTNDPTSLIFFILSIILMVLVLIEMSIEGVSSVWP